MPAAVPMDATCRQVAEWLARLEGEFRVPCRVTLLHVLPVVSLGVDGSQTVSATENLEEVRGELAAMLAEQPGHWSSGRSPEIPARSSAPRPKISIWWSSAGTGARSSRI